jgi:ribose transport system permease protein
MQTNEVAASSGRGMNMLVTLLRMRESSLLAVILAFGAVMTFVSPVFLTKGNMEALFLGLSVEGLIAIGMVMVMITGGFDLSVGSTLAFSGVVVGLLLTAGIPAPLAIIIALAAAGGVGLLNGGMIAKLGINPFIATLGMMMTLRGLLLVLAGGTTVVNLPESFYVIGQGSLAGLQYPIWILLGIMVVMDLLMRNHRFFRQSYFVGGNAKAARLSGMNVARVQIVNYCFVAVLAGLAGLLITARFGAASVTVGTGTELRVITAAIIGGASLSGGEGSVFGAFLGALFMSLVANVLNLLGVDPYWQNLITGLILIGAVLLDTLRQRRKKGRVA